VNDPLTTGVNHELNKVRRNAVAGQNLLKLLGNLYHQQGTRQWLGRQSIRLEERPVPRMICSEALV